MRRLKINSLVALMATFGFWSCPGSFAQENPEITESYTITVTYPSGVSRTIEEVLSHGLIPEENPIFLSIVVQDQRRFLLALKDRDFEFSAGLERIIEKQAAAERAESPNTAD